MFIQNMIIWSRCAYIGTCLLVLHTQAPGRGVVSGNNALTQPLNYSKNKKDLTPSPQKFFKTKKEIHMQTLKIISMIYTAWVLIRFVWLDCKSEDASESVIYKIFSLLQSVVLAYIIIK